MSRINILNKQGFLSSEDRKEPLVHTCDHFTFRTCLDLSEPVLITPLGLSKTAALDKYTQDVSMFISWWMNFVFPDLNGFSGFSGVKFQFTTDVKLV